VKRNVSDPYEVSSTFLSGAIVAQPARRREPASLSAWIVVAFLVIVIAFLASAVRGETLKGSRWRKTVEDLDGTGNGYIPSRGGDPFRNGAGGVTLRGDLDGGTAVLQWMLIEASNICLAAAPADLGECWEDVPGVDCNGDGTADATLSLGGFCAFSSMAPARASRSMAPCRRWQLPGGVVVVAARPIGRPSPAVRRRRISLSDPVAALGRMGRGR
jgi:hypothetical protein